MKSKLTNLEKDINDMVRHLATHSYAPARMRVHTAFTMIIHVNLSCKLHEIIHVNYMNHSCKLHSP